MYFASMFFTYIGDKIYHTHTYIVNYALSCVNITKSTIL